MKDSFLRVMKRERSALVGPAPDLLGIGGGDQLLPEVRMGDGDQHLRPLPGAAASQIHRAVLGDQVVGLAAGIGDDVPAEVGQDAGAAEMMLMRKIIQTLRQKTPAQRKKRQRSRCSSQQA